MKLLPKAPQQGAARVVLALALAGSCAFAQQAAEAVPTPTEEDAVLPPVTVSAHGGLAVPYDSTGVSVTVLEPEKLREAGIVTLSEAMTTVPGVYVMPGGGINQQGNVSYLTVRGLKKDAYTQMMVDGMRLNSSSGNGLVSSNVLARANTFDLGTIEMLRGAQGATYGGGSMAGVLYAETPEGKGRPSLSMFNEGGSHDSYTGNLTAQGEVGKLSYFLSGTYSHTNNDIRMKNGERYALKHAGRATDWAEAVRLDYHADKDNKLTLTYRREDAEYGMPGFGYNASTWDLEQQLSPYEFRSNLVTLKGESRVTRRYTTSLMAGYYGADNTLSSPDYPFRTNIRNVQLEWRNAFEWNEQHRTTGGLSWNRSQYTADSGEGKRNMDRSLENLYGIFAEHTYRPVKRWENSLALRGDASSLFGEKLTSRLASSYRAERTKTRFFGSVGQGYRSPSAFESGRGSASYYGTVYSGNPDLKPEVSRSADIGAEQELHRDHFASATLFVTRTDDAVVSVPDAVTGGRTYANSHAHRTAQGIELALHGTFEKAWNTGYRLACTLTEPKSEHRQVEDSARQVWTADVHTSPIESLTTGIGLAAASNRTDYTGAKTDGYYTLRWYARYKMNEHLSFHVRVENLTDQKFVTEPSWVSPDYAMISAGTSVHAGCTLTF